GRPDHPAPARTERTVGTDLTSALGNAASTIAARIRVAKSAGALDGAAGPSSEILGAFRRARGVGMRGERPTEAPRWLLNALRLGQSGSPGLSASEAAVMLKRIEEANHQEPQRENKNVSTKSFDLNILGQSFPGLTGPSDVMERLERFAVESQRRL